MKEDLSIDQILKSIRQVILGKKSASMSQLPDQDDDVYELTNIVNQDSHSETDRNKEPRNYLDEEQHDAKNSLISSKSTQETSETLKKLAIFKKRLNQSGQTNNPSKSVEDLVTEIMKPYIVNWLDENLPKIVENLVEKEIKKLMPDENNTNSNS
jgi:cell pole-organizing protein PopZ